MAILTRYIGLAVAMGTLTVLMLLLALYSFITFTDEIGSIGRGNYGIIDALSYTALTAPMRIYELFPMAALLGTLIGLGTLASGSELTVMRAAGISPARILAAAMLAGLLLAVAAMGIGEFIAPPAERYAQEQRLDALERTASIGRDGLWVRDGETFVHVRRIDADGRLTGIQLFEYDGLTLSRTVQALSGRHEDGHWQLQDARLIHHDGIDAIKYEVRDNLTWISPLAPGMVRIVTSRPETLALWELSEYIGYLQSNNLDAARYQLAFWTKLTVPLTTAVMVLLAVPFVFGSLRSGSIGQRILIGSLIGIGFYLANQIMARGGLVFDVAPVVAATLPTLLLLGVALLLMRRIR